MTKNVAVAKVVKNCKTILSLELTELRQKLMKWISDWEKHYYVQNLQDPYAQDFDVSAKTANEKLRLVEKILVTWRVPL